MPVKELTTRTIQSLIANRGSARVDYFDRSHKGLCLRVGPKAATWCALRRVAGSSKPERLKLGEFPAMTLLEARAKLDELTELEATGNHPRAHLARERIEQRRAVQDDHARLVAHLVTPWLAHHKLPKKRRARVLSEAATRDYARAITNFAKAFGTHDVGTITRAQIVRYLGAIEARSSAEANRSWTVLRRFFAYARDHFDLDVNPTSDIERPAAQTRRDRVLTRGEIATLWKACELAGYPYGHALRLALLTGQRIGEIGALRRSDIDDSGEWWHQAQNKAGRKIDVYLNAGARSTIADAPYFGPKSFVLSATGGQRGLRSDVWSDAIERHIAPALERARVEFGFQPMASAWTRHDLRRTVSTGLREWCNVDHDTVERVLNHAIGGVRAHYDLASYRSQVRGALDRWHREIESITNTAGPSAVAELRPRARRRTG